MGSKDNDLIHRVNLTIARNLSPLFNKVAREERPVVISRGSRERAVLMSRDQVLRMLRPYVFHTDVIPEEDGGFTLWLRELDIGEHGESLLETRGRLIEAVRGYVRHYLDHWALYRHLPEKAAQEPYVHRLSLAEGDDELNDMLFGAPEPVGTGGRATYTTA